MTFDRVRFSEPADAARALLRQPVTEEIPAAPRFDPLGWIRHLVRRRHADAMLRRTIGPIAPAHSQSVYDLPERLRRDIGLPPPL